MRRAVPALLALAALLLAAVALLLHLLAPRPGEWAATLPVGPWQVRAGVPTLLRLATAPAFAAWLDGRRFATRWGPVHWQWSRADRSLHLACAPCRVALPALGDAPVELPRLALAVFRDGEHLHGVLRADTGTEGGPALQAWFSGRLRQDGLALRLRLPGTPIADAYAVLAPRLPELAQARIGGRLALQAAWDLPAGRLRIAPRMDGFTVQGLGTGLLADAVSACGPPSRLRRGDVLARAVLAAEDQRFFEHPGYDLQELQAALAANRSAGGVRRGASTLSQQLAKRLVTGGERRLERKLRELLYAVEMEQTLGKARILRLYLDNAPWGAGVCGAEAAARHYFGRGAGELTRAQATWLAGQLRRPHGPDRPAD
ncbi:biosynthetic peptidoglycan transglycosylase [Pseudorhodoferax sp.]|uniref:biosynthetic peptidoglycan transglycosylase n=1 Tax=Pseudorhodoferax sp. TaxID=1993553 RepID=UPI0039E4960F